MDFNYIQFFCLGLKKYEWENDDLVKYFKTQK